MIWVLEFEKYWESGDWHTEAHSSLLSIWDIFRRRDIPSFLLYRYHLPNLKNDWVNPREIRGKFGTSDPHKLDFGKLSPKWIILYHVHVFERDIVKFREFLEFCHTEGKEVFIPTPKREGKYLSDFWKSVFQIISEFNNQRFILNELKDEFRVQKLIERSINLDQLLD
jgi:hypothetical protein